MVKLYQKAVNRLFLLTEGETLEDAVKQAYDLGLINVYEDLTIDKLTDYIITAHNDYYVVDTSE